MRYSHYRHKPPLSALAVELANQEYSVQRLVPSLLLLTVAGYAAAESMAMTDDAAKLTVGMMTQVRMDISRGANNAGDVYSPSENGVGKPDTADFYLRRVRPYLKGTFGDGFLFQTTLAADNAGKNGSNTVNVTLFDAFVGRKFVAGDLSHTIVAGKKNAWFYTGNFNQATGLLPSFRPTVPVGVPNNVGVAYRLDAPVIRFGFDVLNNTGTGFSSSTAMGVAGDDTASATTNEGEGLWYSGRLELTGAGDWGSAWQESFAGKPGHGFVIGIEAAGDNKDRLADVDGATAGAQAGHASAAIFGFEGMLHVDDLTAVIDYRIQRTAFVADAAASPDAVHSHTFTIQAGYAIHTGMALVPVLEPAVRISSIDNNTDNTSEGANYGAADYGASGRQFEIGMNAFFNGHKNKLALEYINWTGEEGAAAPNDNRPTAHILRLQQQLWF